MPQIDSLVRELVWQRLTDDALGLNANVDAASGSIDPNTGDPVYGGLDLAMVKNNGWKVGETALFELVSPDDIEASSVMKYPFTALTVQQVAAQRLVVSATFSGLLMFIIQHHVSYIASNVDPLFGPYGDLVKDAMFATFNNPNQQIFASGVVYNGDLLVNRAKPVMGAENWRQTFQINGTFTVIV